MKLAAPSNGSKGGCVMADLLRPWKAGALAALIGMTAMAPAFAKDVKIGVLMPRTGRYAESGLGVSRGIEMVIKDVNAAGGIKSLGGGKIDLVIADNGPEPTKTSLEAVG
jgi:branched-chain amino acid transport system substrate-binding protein